MAKRKTKKSNKNKISLKFLYWLIPLILVLVGVFYLALYLNATNNVTISNTKILDITSFSSKGFTVKAKIDIDNPSILNLNAKKIEYSLTLGDKVTKNTLTAISLPARETSSFRISQEVGYGFTFDIIKDRFLGKDSDLKLNGKIILMESPFVINIPFEAKFDMTDELTDYLSKETKDTAEDIIDKGKKFIDDINPFN